MITDDLSANSQNTSGILSTLHCALGVNVGGFKHSKRTKCEDDGQTWKGGYYNKTKYPSRFSWTNSSEAYFAFNSNVVVGNDCKALYHSCTGPDCKKRINYKGGVVFGSDFGVFLDLSRNFSFGAEVFVDFTKIKLQVNDDSYSCTNPNCQIKQVPLGYDPTPASSAGTDYQNFSELYCKHRFSSDRHYRANVTDNVRHYNKYFYGMLLVAKIYPQSGKCYLALKAGLAKNSYKGPVHVMHEYDNNVDENGNWTFTVQDPDDPTKTIVKKVPAVHTYTRKKIKSRLGIVLKGEFGIFLTDNFAFSLNCGFQSNNQKDNVWSYRLEQAGMSAKFFFGR